MILYHGSTKKVEKPSYTSCRSNTDFGKGFYTTTNLEQAVKWAKLKLQRAGKGHAIVSVFEVEDALFERANAFKILQFAGPDKPWLDFVMANRKGLQVVHYDIVFGPVANDRLYATLALYEQGILSADAAIEQLKTHLLFDQVSFHSQEAMNALIYTNTQIFT
ncbi:MAG: hypothetical protein FD181_2837 [Prolixibacteraceae bacterium]|nr:MAG: hypothetical protein FD181_2837 [Prolixibacteraceae bacterium]